MKGFSFIELLVSLSLVSIGVMTIAASMLESQHLMTQNHQLRIATQLIHTIHEEMHAGQWSDAQLSQWQALAKFYLPEAAIHLAPGHAELSWLSLHPVAVHCGKQDAAHACVGINI